MLRGLRLRSTPAPDYIHLGDLSAFVYGNWQDATSYGYIPSMYGRNYSSEDRCWDSTNPGPPYHSGGGLRIFHYADDLRVSHNGVYFSSGAGPLYRYTGGFVSRLKMSSFNPDYDSGILHAEATSGDETAFTNDGDAEQYGARGWARFRPGSPKANLGQFIGELRDLPRMLSGTAKTFNNLWKAAGGKRSSFGPPSVANDWLNIQFGWLPFIGDLRRFNQIYDTTNKIISNLVKQNNRWIKRGGTVEEGRDVTVVGSSSTDCGLSPILPTQFYSPQFPFRSGSYQLTSERVYRVWFEGKFRYYIPPNHLADGSWDRKARLAIWGALPTPSLIWELTPWSWLVDWGSNVGDVISNLGPNAVENLVAKYAYIMKSTDIELRMSSTLALHDSVYHGSWTYPLSWRVRHKASPFGFSLSSTMFSTRQWSILAALGITKSRVR